MALKTSVSIAVTVVVHTGAVAGGKNDPADMAFIKAFVGVLSDNYPERLRRLILFPFPWYGRAIWSMVRVFVDKRTQDKVILLADTGSTAPPKELFEYVDPREVPVCVGGMDTRPVPDLISTLEI